MLHYTSTATKSLPKPIIGESIDVWGFLNYTLDLLDANLGGTLVKTIPGSTTITSIEAVNTGYRFRGTLASETTLLWPPYYGLAVVQNVTNQTLACTVSGGMPVRIPTGQTIALWGYGDHFVPVNLGPRRYRFDMASPPVSPILLEVSDKLYITFNSVNEIALHVASFEGLYRVFLVVTASESSNNDLVFHPNDSDYAGAFSSWGQTNSDLAIDNTAVITSPYIDPLPRTNGNVDQGAFYFDLFFGPSTTLTPPGPDNINGIGPTMVDLMVSTTTIAKIIKSSSGVAGGAGNCVSKWNDWTTPWTSLGYMTLCYPALSTGYVTVERLA